MTPEELLRPRYKVIAEFPRIEDFEGCEIDNIIITLSEDNLYEKYPHLFKKLGWWEDRKEEDMPMYLKRTGMVDDDDSPLPDWYLKVKKHFNYGNGEWRDNSVHIFCIDPSERTYGTGLFYSEFEPCTEEEYQNDKY
jgi:hypothetical protein